MNEPIDPWKLLELDRNTAGEREVKRAYARLLKQYRPEQDPEGFRRVHEAYQAALADLARGVPDLVVENLPGAEGLEEMVEKETREALAGMDAAGSGERSATTTKAQEAMVRPVEAGVLDVFEQTKANFLKRLGMVNSSGDFPEFNRLRNLVREYPELMDRWVDFLAGQVDGPAVGAILYGLHPEDVWLMMREGQGQFAAGVVLEWRKDIALLGRVRRLGTLMLEQVGAASRDHPDRLRALHFVARVSAFFLPEVSGKLADELFQQMPPSVREEMVREIEIRASVGRTFSNFSLAEKHFWEHQIFEADADETVDWTEPQRLAALRQVVANCPLDWDGWGVVRHVVPESVLKPLMARRQKEPKPIYQTELASDNRWWDFGGRWTWVLIVIVVKGIILGVGSMNSGSDSRANRRSLEERRESFSEQTWKDMPHDFSEQAQRKLEELRLKNGGQSSDGSTADPPRSRPADSLLRTDPLVPSFPDKPQGSSGTDSRFRLD
jgi:hypothetical protein